MELSEGEETLQTIKDVKAEALKPTDSEILNKKDFFLKKNETCIFWAILQGILHT